MRAHQRRAAERSRDAFGVGECAHDSRGCRESDRAAAIRPGTGDARRKASPIPQEAAEWFVNGTLIQGAKRSWKRTARHPAILATALAVLVLAGIAIFYFVEQLHEFPGSETAKRLLVYANTTRHYQFEPLNTDAINLGDYFFMKSQLEHYDVPMRFADFRARGARVFDDEDGHRVAQVVLAEKGVQFFLYPAEKTAGTRRVKARAAGLAVCGGRRLGRRGAGT